jgi:hypothetical protein
MLLRNTDATDAVAGIAMLAAATSLTNYFLWPRLVRRRRKVCNKGESDKGS